MFSRIITLFLILFVVVMVLPELTLAEESTPNPSPKVSDSYILFWPISAGTTIDNKFFFLKELKEKVIGLFIFGETNKADYSLKLSTKRIVEVEKLLKEENDTAALQTLEKTKDQLAMAKDVLTKAKEKNGSDSAVINIKKQIENLNVFLPSLKSNSTSEVVVKVEEIQNALKNIVSLLP